jgi:pimeloyl-ACP methyl ester carboxylesterase
MPALSINGATLEVLDQGQGPVILLVHGFPLSHAMWSPQIEALSSEYRVIAPDLRGFGKSTFTPGTVTMRQFADDLILMLDLLGISEPVTLCGLSMGGYIAWQFAENYPDRLQALILCDTKASADSEEAKGNRHKLAASVFKHGAGVVAQAMPEKLFAKETFTQQPQIVEQCKGMMLAAHPEGIAAALRGMAERPDVSGLLPRISVPTLVIVGEQDQITTEKEMSQMAALIPLASFLKIPQAGHMAPLEQPEPVNVAILQFLKDAHRTK